MLRSLIKASAIVAALAWSGLTCAVGFGSANVLSALGQPLKVEIALTDVSEADASGLTARLASPDAFKAAGLEYPYSLSKLKFEIVTRNGRPLIKVTSKESVNDLSVTLLVEVAWSSGKLQHEYTILLDPADYKGEQPQAEPVRPIEPVVTVAPPPAAVPAPVAPEEAPSAAPTEGQPAEAAQAASAPAAAAPVTMVEAAPAVTEPTPATPAPVAAPEAMKAAPARAEAAAAPVETTPEAEGETITVRRGDTLSKIAAQVKEPDVTLEQMLVALYRANVKQFDGKNMNRLRAGKILRMPDQSAFENLSNAAAVKEIRIQTANWNAYRQKLAAAGAPAAAPGARKEASGKISTSVADKTPAAKESAKEVLKLSKGEAPGDKTAAGKGRSRQEEAIAKGKAQEETGGRVAMMEKNVQQMQKLVELKGQPATPPAAPPSGEKPTRPKMLAPVPVAPQPEPSLVDEALGMVNQAVDLVTSDPMYLYGLAGLVVIVLGLFVLRRRGGGQGRSKKKSSKPEPLTAALTGSAAAAAAAVFSEGPAAGGGRAPQASVAAKAVPGLEDSEAEDPIKEADLFLNFGRDAQAEEILKDALRTRPSSRPIQLKLLSIYAGRKDANSFSRIAREIKDSGDVDAWEQAAALGRAIDPGNPMYGEGGSGAVAELPPEPATRAAPPIDMDIGFNVPMDLDVTAAAPALDSSAAPAMDFDVSGLAAAPMDFDVSSSQKNAAGEAGGLGISFDITGSQPNAAGSQLPTMDFDVTGSQPKVADLLHMDFDITTSHPGVGEAPSMAFDITGSQPKVTDVAEMPHLDFDISGSQPKVSEMPSMDFDISGSQPKAADAVHLDFDITGSQPKVAEMPSMDFDIAATQQISPIASAPEQSLNLEIASAPMDFDISAPVAGTSEAPSPALETGDLMFDISAPAVGAEALPTQSSAPDIADLTFDITTPPSAQAAAQPAMDMDLGLGGVNLSLSDETTAQLPPVSEAKSEQWQEVATKLDLARAYQEMGDAEGAREILGEVLRDGDAEQRESAQTLMQQL